MSEEKQSSSAHAPVPPASPEAPKIEWIEDLPADAYSEYRDVRRNRGWHLAIGGFWSQGPYNSGYVDYYVRRRRNGDWLLKSVERHGCLDGVTQRDVHNGRLTDDAIQALWGKSLKEAKKLRWRKLVAVWTNAPKDITVSAAAKLLYYAVCARERCRLDEIRHEGLWREEEDWDE